jgi:hypothetical protein
MERDLRSLGVVLALIGAFAVWVPQPRLSAEPAQTANGQTDDKKATQGNPSAKVWVNTKSHVYHCPGTRYYGNTKNGAYMTQADAQKNGNRPAYGKYCQ